MLKFKVTVSFPELDRDRYLADLKDSMTQATIKAARKFLLAAVPLIPIWTGFARGALGNLEDIAGRVQGSRVDSRRGGVTKAKYPQGKKWYYYPPGGARVVRTNLSGRQFATPPKDILSEGTLTRATTKSRIVFKFSVDITYFDYLDKEKWHAFDAGRTAFNAELNRQLVLLRPKIGDYIIKRELK